MNVGFIGCGNMGGALAMAVAKAGGNLYLCDRDENKARELSRLTGGQVTDSSSICRECDFVFLGVKPAGLGSLVEQIKESLVEHGPTLVSMLAGVSTEKITSLIGEGVDVIRIMPNTPVLYGEGVVLISPYKNVAQEKTRLLLSLLSMAGKCEIIEEELIDAASAVSGSGPAFFYKFIEAIAEGGVKCGLGYEEALRYATLTAKGAAIMLLSLDKTPQTLIQEVCSPGGSTIEGMSVLEDEGLLDIAGRAVEATYKKAKTLGQG